MRYRELLFEMDVKSEIINDLMDIITTYKQKNYKEIPMNGNNSLIQYLHSIGHDVSPNELMELMNNPPFDDVVEKSDPEKITIKTNNPEMDINAKHKEQAKDKVEKTAAKVANQAVKTGDKT